jgi:pectate lyase-like protein
MVSTAPFIRSYCVLNSFCTVLNCLKSRALAIAAVLLLPAGATQEGCMLPPVSTIFRSLIATIVLFASFGCAEQAEVLPNSQTVDIKAIAITPSSPNVPVLGSAQLHAIASYADGSTADITSTAAWASSAAAVAPLGTQGLLTCKTAGSSNISASAGGVAATAPLTCSVPPIIDVKIKATPLVIRSNSPFEYQLLADYSDGTTTDVTASATWATDPSIASVTSDGLLNCNNPGETTISGTFSGMTVQAPFTCVLRSITPRPGFVESAKTFDGPFTSWTNVKTAFGAKGDGVTDDTAALQAALNSLVEHPAVLWIPLGKYVITSPLTIRGLENITILGEDPLTTTISWSGTAGGTMLTLSGCSGFNIGRLTLDGRGYAGVNLEVAWDEVSNYYPTRNLLHDSRIINTETGIHAGWAGETTVDRVHFDHNTQAGISLGTFNTLNWNVLDSLFTDDAIGVTNWYGAGAFNVTNSVFVRSTTADIKIGNTGSFSLRSNLSVDSMKFFSTGMTGAPANIIIQGNTIYHPGSSPIATGTPGSLMILDNQFLDLDASFNVLFSFCNSPVNFISVGNTYAVPQPFGGDIGRYTSVDEAIDSVDPALPWVVPTEVYMPRSKQPLTLQQQSGGSFTFQ